MKKIFLILVTLIIVFSFKQKVAVPIKSLHHTKIIINPEESVNIIETSQEFELKHNEIFQKDLQIKSKEYYDNVIEIFIEEETSFFRLFGELWDRPFKSEDDRKTLWKLKIERYFRISAYLTYIRNEVAIYTNGVNNQRNNGISKTLGIKNYSNLNLPIVQVNSFNAKNESVDKIISKINDEIIDQLADNILGFTPEIILLILGLFGIWKTKGVGCLPSIIIAGLLAIVFIWRSHKRQNEIREILKTECYNTLNSNKIDYLYQLNKNTIDYYAQLKKINYEANK